MKTTERPFIGITPNRREDAKYAKMMEIIANSHWKEYGGIIEAIVSARAIAENFGGVIDDYYWNNIMEEVVKMRIEIEK